MAEPMSPEGYAAAGGHVCPVCGATGARLTLSATDSTRDPVVFRRVRCRGCHAHWLAVYELTGYEGLTTG